MPHNKNQYIPYTYLIGWTQHNKWYYGVRYAKNCNPNDLWVNYKTSSRYVADFVKEHGDPDIIQVRKTFENSTSARLWEEKVLCKMNVITEDKWLNRSNVRAIDPLCHPRGDTHWAKHSNEHKLRVSQIMKRAEVVAKVSGDNHYTQKSDWTSENHGMKRLEVREKQSNSVSGDNHYTHKPGYDNSNHYAKSPEGRKRRAELNKIKFTGFKHRKIGCIHCSKEISANNYPQHLRKCATVIDNI
jgi:hypothetical protein